MCSMRKKPSKYSKTPLNIFSETKAKFIQLSFYNRLGEFPSWEKLGMSISCFMDRINFL